MGVKERIGNKLRDAERKRESQYFARRDRELIEKLRAARDREAKLLLREMAKMRCPRCGQRLQPGILQEISIEECPECRGMWLDRSELAALTERKQQG